MDTELFSLLLESLSGVAVLALGFWFIIARMRSGRSDPTERYMTKHAFYESIDEGRKLADKRHESELKAIKHMSDEFREALNQTNQNHLDHVQHGHDD